MPEIALAWDLAPPDLVVEPCDERPDALLFSFPIGTPSRALSELTQAEAGVLDAVRRGLSNSEIARKRAVSVRTVANQIASLFRKLGAQSRLDLVLLAAGSTSSPTPCPSRRTGDRPARRTPVR